MTLFPCNSGIHQLQVMMLMQKKINEWRNVLMREGQADGVDKCGLRVTDGDSVPTISSCPSIPSSIGTTGHLE